MTQITQAKAILGLLAQTSIHAGTGQNTGAIDLPIQREGHNGYPCVFGSAMKGALRTHVETAHGKDTDDVLLAFGPPADSEDASEYGGALMISDARILLMPVRSLTSQFKWVTCPAILNRFKQDAERFGIDDVKNINIPAIPGASGDEEAIALVDSNAKDRDNSLFLEEYRFKAQAEDLSAIIEQLEKLMATKSNMAGNLKQQLTLVSDDMFSHICQHATPVNAHIAIDSTTGVVKPGALWYEETLPPETLLYVGISANAARKENADMPADKVLSSLTSLFTEGSPWLQVGGNETVGMGWCAVKTLKGA